MTKASSNIEQAKTALSPDFLRKAARGPGVYIMRDAAGEVLYVGKAKDLRRRLSSYAGRSAQTVKTGALLARVTGIETVLTRTEKEALILEASLIKKYRPRYNIILRDDKNYPFIKVTVRDTWPRLMVARRKVKDGSRYFGPFSAPAAMRDTLRHLRKMFPLRRCRGKVLKKRTRPCLNYQMGTCPAPCCGLADEASYKETVRNLLMALEGRGRALIMELEDRMRAAAEDLRFEEAAQLRDRVRALGKTLEKQVVAAGHSLDQDVFGLARTARSAVISVLFVRRGMVNGRQSFLLSGLPDDDAEVMAGVLKDYYGHSRPVPSEVLLPFRADDMVLLSEWLRELKGAAVRVLVPGGGDRLKLIDMARRNAGQVLSEKIKRSREWLDLAAGLGETLQLARMPRRIECLDISNLGGETAVGSLVCFMDGEKKKDLYRHYRIKTVQGPDDYAMMAEVLARRFAGQKNEDNLPDLMMVDGGRGQLGVAARILADQGLTGKVGLAAIAKNKEGKGDRLYLPGRGNPLRLARNNHVLLFLMRIRDESHRFGISLHRKLRRRRVIFSELDRIPGIGAARKQELLKTIGSLQRIKRSSVAELAAVPGIGPDLAVRIRRHFG